LTKGLKVLPNKVFRFIQPALYSGALSASDIQFLYHNPGVAIGESSSIPEPSSILGILSLGVLGIGAALKRKS